MPNNLFSDRSPRFGPQVRLLQIAYFCLGISFFGIVQLLMVLYVIRLGQGPQYLGYFMASGAVAFMLGGIPNGALGQKIGLKPVLLLGVATVSLGMGLMPLTEFLPPSMWKVWAIATHMIMAYGWSMVSVNVAAAMAVVTEPRQRSQAYSLNWALFSAGTLTGNLVGGLLPGWFARLLGDSMDAPGPYRWGLWVAVLVALVAYIPLSRLDSDLGHEAQEAAVQATDARPWRVILLVAITMCLCQAAVASPQNFGNAYLDTEMNVSTATLGLMSSIAQGLCMVCALIGPRLARRIGGHRLLIGASTGVTLLAVPLMIASSRLPVMAALVAVRALNALWYPIFQDYQMKQVDGGGRGLMAGATAMASGAIFTTTSLLGGRLIASRGYWAMFGLGGMLSLVGVALLTLLPRLLRGSGSEPAM